MPSINISFLFLFLFIYMNKRVGVLVKLYEFLLYDSTFYKMLIRFESKSLTSNSFESESRWKKQITATDFAKAGLCVHTAQMGIIIILRVRICMRKNKTQNLDCDNMFEIIIVANVALRDWFTCNWITYAYIVKCNVIRVISLNLLKHCHRSDAYFTILWARLLKQYF